ncbi:MAG TPA: ammonia-forming cytochrome c nitrite reductase subunit c552 [Bacteroidales bacterium]|jgi:nitrite reductase (cytochrome c-552)|nr:ammonia-forming cytochrome c nitrite reductase subunit c552 [Bacteroidales bacterium]HNZ43584.1 ammonia-forming cytochrome c nitrite reductase subunit c552 [Bacteroidales bacterium]HOH84633.1 ammonia-forming cytochrome c nitrite reductase subunit c552 [Bacteroidales bacterium]HPB25530.1 ammonia-forming cytochrome c nitrite reductase subunit c552 [Bacteroidales bacterium]HPI29063.1 ammonia-forming cytochrome c nitrite reductase subunit c552 [Bacteroidales bacterium]
MKSIREITKQRPWVPWVLFFVTTVIVFLIGLFASSIIERRSESKLYFQVVKEIPEWEPDNAVWGENYPREYDTYIATTDTTFASKHGGGATIDYLQKYPELVVLWAGYAFSSDYKQGRGHYHAIEDITNTLRTNYPQPATCWTCKSTDVPQLMDKMGIANFYRGKWQDLGKEVVNPIGCQDCHDPKTMNLRITRPALIEAYERSGRDINTATQQEMRSLVCAQCHVEYYFKGEGKYLTFPWDKGQTVDSMEKYYNEVNHIDFTHALSKTPILKAQHPDFEMFQTGIHGQRDVACADCHMPYRREGGIKFTDHKIQSPLNNISGSCQVCHRESEATLLKNVYDIQDKTEQIRRIAEKNLYIVHVGCKLAYDKGANDDEMKTIHQLIRSSQWHWDWVAAANSMGFHSPVESLRVLALSIQKAQEARLLLLEVLLTHNVKLPFAIPEIATKAEAMKLINLEIDRITGEKAAFLKDVAPTWKKK